MAEQKESEIGPDYLDKHMPELDGLTLRSLTMWISFTSKGCVIREDTHIWAVRRERLGTDYEHHATIRKHHRRPLGKPLDGQ